MIIFEFFSWIEIWMIWYGMYGWMDGWMSRQGKARHGKARHWRLFARHMSRMK